WLGPAIGPRQFEVGAEVRQAFCETDSHCKEYFIPVAGQPEGSKYRADLYSLARRRLQLAGVTAVYGGGGCTYKEQQRFYSCRRQGGSCGRMATLIWSADR